MNARPRESLRVGGTHSCLFLSRITAAPAKERLTQALGVHIREKNKYQKIGDKGVHEFAGKKKRLRRKVGARN